MAQWLKQSTAVEVKIGPFVDRTDGYTSETGESPSVKLSKNGGALAAKSAATTPVHDADGYYTCSLNTTDTGTTGLLTLTVASSANAAPVRHEYIVVPANEYDSIVSGSDDLDVNVTAWNAVSLGTTNPLPNAAAGGAGGLPTDSAGKTAFNDLSTAAVNAQADLALTDIGLDHLVSVSVAPADVATSSIFARIVSSQATPSWSTYNSITDSLQANRDKLTDIETDTQAIETDTQDIQSRLPLALVDGLYMDSNVTLWKGTAIPDSNVAGVPRVDVTHFLGGAVPTPATTGVIDVNVVAWSDGQVPAPTQTGVPEVDVTFFAGGAVPTPATTGVIDVNVVAINDSATAAVNMEVGANLVVTGAFTSTPTASTGATNLTGFQTSQLVGRPLYITSGVAAGEATEITAYSTVNATMTFTDLSVAPSGGDTFYIG